jgi:hypothetical protein
MVSMERTTSDGAVYGGSTGESSILHYTLKGSDGDGGVDADVEGVD